jgi:DNA topoisomerase IA
VTQEQTKPSGHYVGKIVKAVAARYDAKMTEPPPRYREDTLIADMLAAHKFAGSEQERAILKETEGLGTSRTRASTIEGLIQSGLLISKKKKKLYEITSSDVARSMMAHLPEVLTSVATTAKWEVAFKMIERGTTTPVQVRQALASNLRHIVDIAKGTSLKVAPARQATPSRFQSSSVPAKSSAAPASAFVAKTQTQPKVARPAAGPAGAGETSAKKPASGVSSWFR